MDGFSSNFASFISFTLRHPVELWKNWLSVRLKFSVLVFMFDISVLTSCAIVFEDKDLATRAVIAVEKQIHHEDMDVENPSTKVDTSHVEQLGRAA